MKINKVELKFLNQEAKEIYNNKFSTEKEMSAGYDLRVMEDVVLQPGETAFVGSGLSIFINDKNFVAKIYPRSGLGHKRGIVLGNLTGVIDADYQGEIKMSIWNRSKEAQIIKKGERTFQLIFEQVFHPEFNVVEEFSTETIRGSGGFGSSGTK